MQKPWCVNYANTDINLKIIKNGIKQQRMIIKELFDEQVGDYCIARNSIKCLFFWPHTQELSTALKLFYLDQGDLGE